MEKKIIKSLWDLELPSAAKSSDDTSGKLEDPKINDLVVAGGERPNTSVSNQSAAPVQKPPAIQRIVGTEDKDSYIAKEMSRLQELARNLNQKEARLAADQKELSGEHDRFKSDKLSLQSRLNQLVVHQRDCTDKEKANYRRAAELDAREANLVAGEQGLLTREARMNQREIDLENFMAEAKRPEIEFKDLQATLETAKSELDRKCEEVSKLFQIQEDYELLKNKIVTIEADLEESESALSDEVDEHVKTRGEIKILNQEIEILHHEVSELNDKLVIMTQKFRDQNNILTEVQRERDILKWVDAENKSLRIAVEQRHAESRELHKKIAELGASRARVTPPFPEGAKETASPFSVNNMAVLHWLSSEVSDPFQPPEDIVTLGSGPIPEGDFDEYLKTLGIRACESRCEWIVVGRSGWTPKQLDELITASNPSTVRIFSQELFIAGILTTHDPFAADPELLIEFSQGHPALEYLMKCGFEWPEIADLEELDVPQYVRGAYERVDESPIYRMGYVVGITNGLSAFHRQSLLRKAYEGVIPQVEDADYMEEWGEPGTRKRLWRIAHHIAWLIRSRRSNPVMSYAVSDWVKDLEWLEIKYFKDSMRFSWPNF